MVSQGQAEAKITSFIFFKYGRVGGCERSYRERGRSPGGKHGRRGFLMGCSQASASLGLSDTESMELNTGLEE